jgi:hypothetical protein
VPESGRPLVMTLQQTTSQGQEASKEKKVRDDQHLLEVDIENWPQKRPNEAGKGSR